MAEDEIKRFVRERFARVHDAEADTGYPAWHASSVGVPGGMAALGYRKADGLPLFLEAYLDVPVEHAVSTVLGRPIAREAIVEIGCLASTSPVALIQVWHAVAMTLDAQHLVVVATLTATLRRLVARIGIPVIDLAAATVDRVTDGARWGRYYDDDPRVCVGVIADGAASLHQYIARRTDAA